MTLGRSQICDRTSFRISRLNRKASWRFSSFRIPSLKWERLYEGFLFFAYLAWSEKGFYDGSFRLHTSILMRKVLWWFSAFHFLVVWFLLSFVFLLLRWRIGGYGIFSVLRSVFFSESRVMFGFGGVLAMVLQWFFGCFCCVWIEILRFWSGVGEGCALWRLRNGMWALAFSTYINLGLLIIWMLSSVALLVCHVVMRNRKSMV